ncbi:MAG TPA: glycosyl hydrolase, partial [Tepidisphaeraceae bacterium]|nr:glycosyl hydrolase [Tepidisphaeraceae bacterium]
MKRAGSYRKCGFVVALFLLTVTVRAGGDTPRPLPNHPGNIFVEGENVSLAGDSKQAGGWKLVDYDGKTIKEAKSGAEPMEFGKLPIGYYELRGADGKTQTTIGVIAPLAAPTPKTSPIGIDVAMAWIYPDEAQRHAVANLCNLAGMNWVRDRMSWPELESKPGEFAPPNRYDQTAELQTKAGLNVLQVNHIGPPWLKNAKRFPLDLRDAYRFYKEMAKRFKGKIVALEPWNEADIDMFGGHTGCEMASMQKASYLGIKAGNPDMIACQNVFAIARPETLADFTANRAGPYFDRFDVHHYVALHRYDEYYALYRAASSGKPMWVTEFNITVSWSGDPKAQEPNDQNLHIQAERVAKMFSKTLFNGVKAQFYFMLPHYVEGKLQYGLLRPDLTPRPGYVSLAAAGRLLAGAKPLGRLKVANEDVTG